MLFRLMTFIIYITFIVAQDEDPYLFCQEKNSQISSKKNDAYVIANVKINQTLTLQCRYCGDGDNDEPRNWYKADDLGETQGHEVNFDMNNDPDENRVTCSMDHDLVIRNFSQNDTGYYYCNLYGSKGNAAKFSFLVGVDQSTNESNYITGNLTRWKNYHDDYILPANRRLQKKAHEHGLNLSMEVAIHFKSWGKCSKCGKEGGVRRKIGFCVLKIKPNRVTKKFDKLSKEYGWEHKFDIYGKIRSFSKWGCVSKSLTQYLPKWVYPIVDTVPDFVREEPCQISCGIISFVRGRSKMYKYRKIVTLPEKSHYVMVCPETTLDTVIKWEKAGKVMKQGRINDHVTINVFNSIFFTDITVAEEGNYTCTVNGIQMQTIQLFIIKQRQFFTAAFFRYILYLAFILSLTLSCYCAGLVIAYTRRYTFLSYEELKLDEERGIKHTCLF